VPNAAAAALIFGGVAIQFRRTAKAGAVVLGAAYLVLVLLCVPGIVAAPRIYNSWGNFFEQFSLLSGAAMITVANWLFQMAVQAHFAAMTGPGPTRWI